MSTSSVASCWNDCGRVRTVVTVLEPWSLTLLAWRSDAVRNLTLMATAFYSNGSGTRLSGEKNIAR